MGHHVITGRFLGTWLVRLLASPGLLKRSRFRKQRMEFELFCKGPRDF